jgi:hypothetical protein
MVVLLDPSVQILLQLLQAFIDFLSEGYGIEPILNGPMQPLKDAIPPLLVFGLSRLASAKTCNSRKTTHVDDYFSLLLKLH